MSIYSARPWLSQASDGPDHRVDAVRLVGLRYRGVTAPTVGTKWAADPQVLLDGETEAFESLGRLLAPDAYETATPAAGWSTRDDVSHLAYSYEASSSPRTTRPASMQRRR